MSLVSWSYISVLSVWLQTCISSPFPIVLVVSLSLSFSRVFVRDYWAASRWTGIVLVSSLCVPAPVDHLRLVGLCLFVPVGWAFVCEIVDYKYRRLSLMFWLFVFFCFYMFPVRFRILSLVCCDSRCDVVVFISSESHVGVRGQCAYVILCTMYGQVVSWCEREWASRARELVVFIDMKVVIEKRIRGDVRVIASAPY